MPASEALPGVVTRGTARVSRRARLGALLRREGGWLAAALLVVGIAWVVTLPLDPRHFYSGDTEQAYYGWWYAVGDALRHGHLALLDPQQLGYGNHVLDGQLGLYNPLIALVGLGATVAPQLVVYATAVKFLTAAVGVIGCYALVRSYRVAPPLAGAASVAVALCGFTYALSAARWFDGQLGVALLPWAWWTTRRLVHGRSPFPALLCCLLIVTIGYVYPTLYLGAVLLVCLLEALLLIGWRAVLKVVLVGVFCALVAVLVYLPGILTAGMTVRSSDRLVVDGPNRLEWWQLPLLWQPVGRTGPEIYGFRSQSPVAYVVWWLPLLLLVELRLVRERWREVVPLAVGALVWCLWCIGPARLGPLRWPTRSLDALTLMAAVLVVVAVVRCTSRRPSALRVGVLAAFVVLSELLVVLWHHDEAGPRLASTAALLVGLVVGALWLRRSRRLGAILLLGSLAFGLVAALVPQSAMPTLAMPGDKVAYDHVVTHSRGTIIQINAHKTTRYSAERGRHLLRGSLWTLTGKPVVNGYTTAQPRSFQRRFKGRYMGAFAPRTLKRLFAREQRTTGRRFVDLCGISTIILERGRDWGAPPRGWHVADRDAVSVTWIRDRPIAPAGNVAWTSPGTSVQTVAEGPLGVSFRVTGVPAEGGSVVLSRIAWTGYRVSGARFGRPLAKLLLRVHVPAGAEGRVVTVTFRPPGWRPELLCAALAVALWLGWSGAFLLRRRRSARTPRPDSVPA
ncbi:hypothetical protein AB3X52_18665 [Nocardioides sp. DS6]|uniref:YfhO family protein n=1 Tax=Nocardioides eburneus TaxID=3231482 RepID=A0ABV3T4C7_9ACTN